VGRKATGPDLIGIAGSPKSRAELSTHTYGETPKAGFENFDNSAFLLYARSEKLTQAKACDYQPVSNSEFQ